VSCSGKSRWPEKVDRGGDAVGAGKTCFRSGRPECQRRPDIVVYESRRTQIARQVRIQGKRHEADGAVHEIPVARGVETGRDLARKAGARELCAGGTGRQYDQSNYKWQVKHCGERPLLSMRR
jgi:hypothetical protein